MDNYFTSFCLVTHLEVNNIRATGMLNKNRLRKCTIIGTNSCKKRNVATLNSAHQAKKQCNFDSCWLEQQQGETKLKESLFKSNNQINSTVATRTWFFSTKWTGTLASTALVSESKNDGGPRLFEW